MFAEHHWLQNAKKASNVPLGDIVRTRLKQFSMMNRFKKKALWVSIYFRSYTIVDSISLLRKNKDIVLYHGDFGFLNKCTGNCRTFIY